GRFDAFMRRMGFLPQDLSDQIMQAVSLLFPSHLPKRMKDYRDRYEHHLLLRMDRASVPDARRFLESTFPSAQGDFFECSDEEAEKLSLPLFAVAGAAIRYRAFHRRKVEDIVALDVALRRNDPHWFETLPEDVSKPIIHKLYYGHFFCHVFHQDYIVGKGHDTLELEHRMWKLLDARGAQYPADPNVVHLYNP